MKAALRGTEIYFDITGMQLAPQQKDFTEQPVLFLLHGGPGGNHLRYKHHSIDLQDVAQLVFIDHRGCGLSKKTHAREYTLENNIEDIEALRKHLGLEKICLLGTSYGGMVAQGYAIRYPKHVEKLILVATAPSYHFLKEAKEYLEKNGNKKQIAVCQDLWNGKFKDMAHLNKFFVLMDDMYSVTGGNKRHAVYSKLKSPWSLDALNTAFTSFLRTYNFVSQLKKIKAPTLILTGQDDWLMRPTQAKIMQKNIPNAILKIFKHCGHAVATDAHDKYIKAIKQFLK